MPNIEMHGFKTRVIMDDDDTQHFEMIKTKIHQVIRDLGMAEEGVITIHNTTVERCDGTDRPAPYLRVCGSDDAEIQTIIEALIECKIGVDCESLTLDDFYPDLEMGAQPDDDSLNIG